MPTPCKHFCRKNLCISAEETIFCAQCATNCIPLLQYNGKRKPFLCRWLRRGRGAGRVEPVADPEGPLDSDEVRHGGLLGAVDVCVIHPQGGIWEALGWSGPLPSLHHRPPRGYPLLPPPRPTPPRYTYLNTKRLPIDPWGENNTGLSLEHPFCWVFINCATRTGQATQRKLRIREYTQGKQPPAMNENPFQKENKKKQTEE